MAYEFYAIENLKPERIVPLALHYSYDNLVVTYIEIPEKTLLY